MEILSLLLFFGNVHAIKWLNKAFSQQRKWHPDMCEMPKFHLTLKQIAVCRKNINKMPFVSQSAVLTKDECTTNFIHSKWNCNSVNRAPYFNRDLLNETREAAVLHAMSAASLAYVIATKCATGNIKDCACKHAIVHGRIRFPQKVCDVPMNKKAIEFAKEFIDPGDKKLKKVQQKSPLKATMMKVERHNRNVGYKVFQQIKTTNCICPGTTSGCQMKACYQTLPDFKTISLELKKRYQEATRVTLNAKEETFEASGQKNKVSEENLVFSTALENPCNTTDKYNKISGRFCSLELNAENYCKTFCCKGEYENRRSLAKRQCNCNFVWCCKIECDTCYTHIIRQFCK